MILIAPDVAGLFDELCAQWGECVMLAHMDGNTERALAYQECINELKDVMRGEDGPVKKWEIYK